MEQVAQIAYGKRRIPLKLEEGLARWQVITPRHEPAFPNPREGFIEAARNPIGSRPLREVVGPTDRVVIATCDGTRPVPNHLLIPWILEELPCPVENVTILLGTGTHRPNTPAEIDAMFGAEVARSVKIVNHNCFDEAANVRLGKTSTGGPVTVDKLWHEADKRIVVGFIEPHFFAGFSGGAKGVVPGVAALETILHLHSYRLIADPQSTFGVLDGNPIQQEIHEMVAQFPPDFMVNVSLNPDKQITGFYLGDYRTAHRAGCDRVKTTSMAPVERRCPVVVTSNSGFPLDQNLYQTVKGISAAELIVEDGGTIFVVSECSDGIPSHGNFGQMMKEGATADAILDGVRNLREGRLDQWQAQILARVLKKCEIVILSELDAPTAEMCKLRRTEDLQGSVEECLRRLGKGAEVAILPDGPITIPYLMN